MARQQGARAMTDIPSNTPLTDDAFFPVSPLMLFPETRADFRVYLKQHGRFVLYTRERQAITQNLRQALFDLGVATVYVLDDQKREYDRYLEQNLGSVLGNVDIPHAERSKMFYSASRAVLQEIFEKRLPDTLGRDFYDRMKEFVAQSMHYLTGEEALKNLSRLISHDYKTFTHSIHVFTYAMGIYNTYEMEEKRLLNCGLGALLHDIGKTRIPRAILNNPDRLTREEEDEYRRHPLHGVAMCSMIPLTQDAVNSILFHHERYDGKGFPTAARDENIPLSARVVKVCDDYDKLTTSRPGYKAITPFQALSKMRDESVGAYDMDVYKRLVLVLSGADIV